MKYANSTKEYNKAEYSEHIERRMQQKKKKLHIRSMRQAKRSIWETQE